MSAATGVIAGAAVASAASGAISAADASRRARNAASDAAKAAEANKINPQLVASQAHDQAIKNAIDSQNLEKQLNPLAPQLRTQSMQAIIDSLKGGTYDDGIKRSLYEQFNQPGAQAPAFQDYSQGQLSQQSQAEALRQLQLGGKLDQETANQVIRSSAAHAGQFGGGLGLGRDLSARDLGLSSLQLQQQRLATAGQFGQSQDAFTAQHAAAQNAYGLSATQLQLQQQQQRYGLGLGLYGLGQSDFQRALAAGQFGQSIQQPITGLDPGAYANLSVGAQNQQGAAAQNAAAIQASAAQGQAQAGGQMFGAGLSALGSLYGGGFGKPQYGYSSPTTYGSVGYSPPSPTGNAYLGTFGPKGP